MEDKRIQVNYKKLWKMLIDKICSVMKCGLDDIVEMER